MARHADTAEISDKLDDIRRFIDRRFAELSTEIHATVQLVDYSEATISGRLEAMAAQIAAVLASPSFSTRNSGVELEAVVQTTEAAANRIMEAAEAIGEWLIDLRAEPELCARISAKVAAIFEACSFQDLTSQRIRRAIEQLHHVEAMLASMSNPAAAVPRSAAPQRAACGPDLAQRGIDEMLAGG